MRNINIATTLLYIFVCNCIVKAEGVLLVKSKAWSAPATATIVPYKSIERFPAVHNIITPSGQEKRISVALIVEDIDFDLYRLEDKIVTEAEKNQVRNRAHQLNSLLTTKSKLAPYLKNLIDDYKSAISQLCNGKIRINALWIDETEYQKQQEDIQKKNRIADQVFQTENQEKRSKEKAELASKIDTLISQIAEVESELELHREKIIENRAQDLSSEYEFRRLLLERKLPRASFKNLYDLSDYVYEVLTESGEKCALVSYSIASVETRVISIWVRYCCDIDVLMRNGNEERIRVFIEADETTALLSTQIQTKKTELKILQGDLKRRQ